MKIINLVLVIGLLNLYSCKKEPTVPLSSQTKFKFLLYTNEIFPEPHQRISFNMYIRNNSNVMVDSLLVTMPLGDIPNAANKLVFQRTVEGNYQGVFTVGFKYSTENVGNSWHLEACQAGTAEKTVDFNFR